MISGRDVICLSSIDWDFIWQGHQEIMSRLAANGQRVLFVENTGVRPLRWSDLPRLKQRLRNWRRGTKGFREERPNLFVQSPLVLPFPYSGLARRINRWMLSRSITRWMTAVGASRPVVWTFLPTPLARDVIASLDPALTIYYCIDDLASSSPEARKIGPSEEALFKSADLVFTTSEKLRARAARFSDRVHLFPFAVNMGTFEKVRDTAGPLPADLAQLQAADRRLRRRPAPVGRSGVAGRRRRAAARCDVCAGRPGPGRCLTAATRQEHPPVRSAGAR